MKVLSSTEIQQVSGGAGMLGASLFVAQNVIWGLTAYVGLQEFKTVILSYSAGTMMANALSTTVLGVSVGAVAGTLIGAIGGYASYSLIASL